jgi:molybdopterin-binding protein
MKLSARNVFPGTVIQVTKGDVNAQVHLALESGDKIVSCA